MHDDCGDESILCNLASCYPFYGGVFCKDCQLKSPDCLAYEEFLTLNFHLFLAYLWICLNSIF